VRVLAIDRFAADLAEFIATLATVPTEGRTWNGSSRGGPPIRRDDQVRRCIADSAALVDARRLEAAWDDCITTGPGDADVWIHADLMPGNLLVREDHLSAVIDWEMACVGTELWT